MRDLLVVAVVIVSLPVSFFRPWIGVLVWSWLGYMNPHRLTWGFAYTAPLAEMVALATLIGIPFFRTRFNFPWRKEVFLLLGLWGIFLLSTLFSIHPQEAWPQFSKVSKIILMTFVTIALFRDKEKIRYLLLVIALSIGFFGLKGGIWAILTGGQNQVLGPPDSFLAGNTEVGLALNMVLPILLILRREETRRWIRHLLLAIFFFSIVAILITYSRGAFLGLVAVLSVLFLKSRAKRVALVLIAVGIPLAIFALPDKWVGRVQTINTYEEDASSMNRILAWKLSWRLGLAHPLVGFGFFPFTPEIYDQYLPEHTSERRRGADAHNIFFQVLAEHGFPGLALYVFLVISTLMSLGRVIRMARGDPQKRWLGNYANMIQACLVGFIVNGFFLSRSYFDLFFHFVAISILLKQLAEEESTETDRTAEIPVAGALGQRC